MIVVRAGPACRSRISASASANGICTNGFVRHGAALAVPQFGEFLEHARRSTGVQIALNTSSCANKASISISS